MQGLRPIVGAAALLLAVMGLVFILSPEPPQEAQRIESQQPADECSGPPWELPRHCWVAPESGAVVSMVRGVNGGVFDFHIAITRDGECVVYLDAIERARFPCHGRRL